MTVDYLDIQRAEILDFMDRVNWDDPGDRYSAMNIVDAYNGMVPPGYQIGRTSQLTVQLGNASLHVKRQMEAFERVVAAVAFLVKEGRRVDSPPTLTSADYVAARLEQRSMNGQVIFAPREERVEELRVRYGEPSPSEQALRSIVALLPAPHSDDDLALDAIRALRAHTRKAVLEISAAAQQTDGLSMFVSAVDEDEQRAVVTADFARRVTEELELSDEKVERVEMVGVLEGARTKRRIFYLDRSEGDIHGGIDEQLIRAIPRLLGRRVVAQLDMTQAVGSKRTPRYRLVGISALPDVQPPLV